MPYVMTIVGDRLKQAMARKDMDQITLAQRAGCTQGAISQILLGKTRQSRFLPKIASALDVPVRWLMGEIDEQNENLSETGYLTSSTPQVAMMVNFPSEAALASMFEGLLAIVPADATRGEAARILARRLPSGFAAIGPLVPDQVVVREPDTSKDTQTPAGDRLASAPQSRK